MFLHDNFCKIITFTFVFLHISEKLFKMWNYIIIL